MVERFLSLACRAVLSFGQFDIRVLKLSLATCGIDTIALYWLLYEQESLEQNCSTEQVLSANIY